MISPPSWVGRRRPARWHVLAAIASLPIAAAATRGVRRGHLAIGDNALIEIRARDVLTAHHPWLGTWSSASISSGIDVNHPGPLVFDVLALPVRLLGAGPGMAFGVAALQIAVVWAIAFASDRLGGRSVMTVVMAVTSWFAWSLGSELLYDPWQPNLLMLPFLLLLVLVWGVLAGRHAMLPWAVVVASFCVQTHLSYVFLGPAVLLVGAVAVAVRRDPRPLVLGLVVGLVAWAQPLAEQLFGPGQGNLSRLAASGGGGDGVRTGVSLGLRLVAGVVALPPWWGRSGVMDTIPVAGFTETAAGPTIVVPGLAAAGWSTLALVVVAVALVWITVASRRRGDIVLMSGAVVAGVALTVATLTTIITPIDVLGLSPHKLRWLWPIAVTITAVLIVAVGREVARRLPGDRAQRLRELVGPVGVGVVALGAVATLPFHAHDAGPVASRADMARIRVLVDQLDVLRGRGVVRMDSSGLWFAEPFTAPVKAGLQRAGVPFVVPEEGLVRQMGERRRDTGQADLVVWVRAGEEALDVPDGAERVAFAPGLSESERAELDAFEAELADWVVSRGPGASMVPAGADVTEIGRLALAGEVDVSLALGPDRAGRFLELDERWRGLGLAVFARELEAS